MYCTKLILVLPCTVVVLLMCVWMGAKLNEMK